MPTATRTELYTLPEAAPRLGLTSWQLLGVLARHPDLRDSIPRLGGRRVFGPDELQAVRDVLAAEQNAKGSRRGN